MTKTSALVLACTLTGLTLAACGGAGSGGAATTTRPPAPTAAQNAGTEPPKQYDYGAPRTAAPSSSPDYYGY